MLVLQFHSSRLITSIEGKEGVEFPSLSLSLALSLVVARCKCVQRKEKRGCGIEESIPISCIGIENVLCCCLFCLFCSALLCLFLAHRSLDLRRLFCSMGFVFVLCPCLGARTSSALASSHPMRRFVNARCHHCIRSRLGSGPHCVNSIWGDCIKYHLGEGRKTKRTGNSKGQKEESMQEEKRVYKKSLEYRELGSFV